MKNLKQRINFGLWRKVHVLPQFFIVYWQLRELKRVVGGAYHRILFYKALLDAEGVRPENIRTLADLGRLPIMSKQLFRRHPQSTMNAHLDPKTLVWEETSGSTGEPFRFPNNTRFYFRARFGCFYPTLLTSLRFLLWHGYTYRHIAENIKIAQIRIAPPPTERHLFIPVAEIRKDPREVIRRLREYGPDIVETLPSVLMELGRKNKEVSQGERLAFRYAICHGEMLTARERAYIERAFSCEVYNRYGLQEFLEVGVECENHNGFHLYEESFIVEILDGAGHSLPSGVAGRIVVTHFYNDAIPFIRYDTGDEGVILPDRCSCGIPSKRLLVNGRKGGCLVVGGKKINHAELMMALSRFSSTILKYQLAKTGKRKTELRIIPVERFTAEDGEFLRAAIKTAFSFTPAIRIVKEIKRGQNGKMLAIVDESKIGVQPR